MTFDPNVQPLFHFFSAELHRIKYNYSETTTEAAKQNIEALISFLPHGSGIDSKLVLNYEKSNPEKIVIEFSFHHMDSWGYYSHWSDYTVVITPSFIGEISVDVKGRNTNDIKDYLHDVFYNAAREVVRRDATVLDGKIVTTFLPVKYETATVA